jgi:hypothetical protein
MRVAKSCFVAEFVRTLNGVSLGDNRILTNPATTGCREPDRAAASSDVFEDDFQQIQERQQIKRIE